MPSGFPLRLLARRWTPSNSMTIFINRQQFDLAGFIWALLTIS
jgi:hypothetical protein